MDLTLTTDKAASQETPSWDSRLLPFVTLERLIDDALISAHAVREGVAVDASEVKASMKLELEKLPELGATYRLVEITGGITRARKRLLSRLQLARADYVRIIRQRLERQELQTILTSRQRTQEMQIEPTDSSDSASLQRWLNDRRDDTNISRKFNSDIYTWAMLALRERQVAWWTDATTLRSEIKSRASARTP